VIRAQALLGILIYQHKLRFLRFPSLASADGLSLQIVNNF
jgi:hypothetical protein